MKIFVCYRVNQYSKRLAGVFRKLEGQLKGFESSGLETYVLYMSYDRQCLAQVKQGKFIDIHQWYPVNIEGEQETFWLNARDALDRILPDVVYVRYERMFNTPVLHGFFSYSKFLRCVNLVEFPTFPYAHEIEDRYNRDIDCKARKGLVKWVDCAFSTSVGEFIDDLPNVHFNNKIDVSDLTLEGFFNDMFVSKNSDKKLNFISVANISFWHGFDRVLYGMRECYNNEILNLIHYHIVGDGEEKQQLELLCKNLGLQKYVTFHGFQHGKALQSLYLRAHLGIGGIGLHRKGITQNSALKVREYLQFGLPVVKSTHDSDVDHCPYYMNVSADDSPLNIQNVIDFANSVSLSVKRKDISSFARDNFSWISFASNVKDKANEIQVTQR